MVIAACAEPRGADDGTWISAEMQQAYIQLHELGMAHSIEVWMDKELAGGIYGIALGKVFFGESMFSNVKDSSKVALIALCRQLERWGFTLLDCQISNPHLMSMGAQDISRADFEKHLGSVDGPEHWIGDFSCDSRW